MEQVITKLYLAIATMMVTFAALQLTGRQKTRVNYRLGILFFSLGYVWLYYGLFRANRLVWAPWLLYSDVFVPFLVGPFLYAHASELAGVTPCRPVPRLLPYLPALAFLIYMIILKPAAGVSGAALPGPNPDHFEIPVVGILNLLADLFFFCYVLASTRNIIRIYRAGDRPLRKAFRGVVTYFSTSLGTSSFFSRATPCEATISWESRCLRTTLPAPTFFFLNYRYPEYTQ